MNKSNLIGSEFETSLRLLILLKELCKFTLNEHQIACIDFVAIYAADFGLFELNLHGDGLFRHGEFSAKSKLVAESLKNLVYHSYVKCIANRNGYFYELDALGIEIANSLTTNYANQYRIAVNEVLSKYPSLDSKKINKEINNKTLYPLEVYDE
ncbi:ABC-three component system middle component 2 [Hutsoniella sourekii]|uniref:ABC-three component system middle component 2 n=1 Tax=Hutsoniella sourekii TaxID=87650 RepID=UPI000489E657|nr:ABC-three component system middle component 2 [Hutsoniella sourekii]